MVYSNNVLMSWKVVIHFIIYSQKSLKNLPIKSSHALSLSSSLPCEAFSVTKYSRSIGEAVLEFPILISNNWWVSHILYTPASDQYIFVFYLGESICFRCNQLGRQVSVVPNRLIRRWSSWLCSAGQWCFWLAQSRVVIQIVGKLRSRLAVRSNTIPWAIANVSRDSIALVVDTSLSIVSFGNVVRFSSILGISFGYGFGFKLW